MNELQPGQRFPLPQGEAITIRFDGRDAARLAVAAITPRGHTVAFDQVVTDNGCFSRSMDWGDKPTSLPT